MPVESHSHPSLKDLLAQQVVFHGTLELGLALPRLFQVPPSTVYELKAVPFVAQKGLPASGAVNVHCPANLAVAQTDALTRLLSTVAQEVDPPDVHLAELMVGT